VRIASAPPARRLQLADAEPHAPPAHPTARPLSLARAVDELFFDGRHVASALQINNVMGTTVQDSYFLNFSSYGLQINAGHEVMMQHCWSVNRNAPWTAPTSTLSNR
jgi:hypothetical protein